MKYKLEIMVDASEISYNDTHIIITKNTPSGIATFSVPNPEAKFVAEGFKNGTHFESYYAGGWIIEQCDDFPLWDLNKIDDYLKKTKPITFEKDKNGNIIDFAKLTKEELE